MKFKKVIVVVLLLAVASYGGYAYYKKQKAAESKVQTVRVEKSDIRSSISATGTVKPVNSVDISSKITGRIVDVKVQENDWVKAGQTLVLLDDMQYKSDLAQKEAALKNATANFNRMSALIKQGAIAWQDYDTSERDYKVALATYEKSSSDLDDTIIRAPVDGLVVGKPVPAGQTVAPGISTPMVLMTIADMSIMQSETLVDESDIGQVAKGQKVEFTVDSYPDMVFHGVVSLISRKAETQNNVIYYKVYVDVADARNKLFPNMTSRVIILTDEKKGAMTLPFSAVRDLKGKKYVQVVRPGGQTEDIEVQTGLRGDDRVEIVSGLKVGDEVVLRPGAAKVTDSAAQKQAADQRTLRSAGGGGAPRR